MANPEYAYGAFYKNRVEPKVMTRHRKKVIAEQELLEAYATVDQRDGSVCWVTGRMTRADSPSPETRREHHHLRGRRVRPEWITDPARIVTVCKEAHDLLTSGWLVADGDDARKEIVFAWAEGTKPSQKMLQIKPRGKR